MQGQMPVMMPDYQGYVPRYPYPQFQQNFQRPQFPGVVGKIVNDFSEIIANDVPMDNLGAFFFKSDGTEIQRRVWNAANGSIEKVSYVPVFDQGKKEGQDGLSQVNLDTLNADVKSFRDEVLSRLDGIERSIVKPAPSKGKKVEVSADE